MGRRGHHYKRSVSWVNSVLGRPSLHEIVFNNLLIGPPAFNNFPAIINREAGEPLIKG